VTEPEPAPTSRAAPASAPAPSGRLRTVGASTQQEIATGNHHRPDSSVEGSDVVHDMDDLGWAPEEGEKVAPCVTLAIDHGRSLRTISRKVSMRTLSRRGTSGRAVVEDVQEDDESKDENDGMCHRVQCLFEDGWKDFQEEESLQICDELASGTKEFTLQLRGRNYAFDFRTPGEATQMNVKSGKKRKLRILDKQLVEGDEWPADMLEAQIEEQKRFGPQSKRGQASQNAIAKYLNGNTHAQACFNFFEKNECKYCGDWAVFYHSYSFAALIYEVHAAVASVLFRFRSSYAALPRILVHEFQQIPDAAALMDAFKNHFASHKRDHNPGFRKVGISAMCSLACTGPEACVARVFISGYSCKDISWRNVLENVLRSCHVPAEKVQRLADKIVLLAEKHGLDVSSFGGKPCQSQQAGHLMQIFIRRNLVDQLVYPAEPYGPIDEERLPLSEHMNKDTSFLRGQVRIVAHPKFFMQASHVRLFVASADPAFHKNRASFQEELCDLIKELGEATLREQAATCIYGGTLPSWWTSEDQRSLA